MGFLGVYFKLKLIWPATAATGILNWGGPFLRACFFLRFEDQKGLGERHCVGSGRCLFHKERSRSTQTHHLANLVTRSGQWCSMAKSMQQGTLLHERLDQMSRSSDKSVLKLTSQICLRMLLGVCFCCGQGVQTRCLGEKTETWHNWHWVIRAGSWRLTFRLSFKRSQGSWRTESACQPFTKCSQSWCHWASRFTARLQMIAVTLPLWWNVIIHVQTWLKSSVLCAHSYK